MTTPTKSNYLRVLGPRTPLARVLAFFESDGRSDPVTAWHAFTSTWNWAAPLTTAVPCTDFPGPVVRPIPGGFLVSGQWRLASHEGTGTWLALPLPLSPRLSVPAHVRSAVVAPTGLSGTAFDPDLFVVSSKVLPCAVRALPVPTACTTAHDGGALGSVLRLENAHVPAGLATHAAGVPLCAGDAAFLWTATAALALGAARRITDVLAARTSGATRPASLRSAEPAAALHDERMALAAVLHGAPSAREGLTPSAEELLLSHVERVGNAVREVVAAAYEHAMTSQRVADEAPLVRMIEETSPILHQLRFARELLPRGE